jgi:hypothetical protein
MSNWTLIIERYLTEGRTVAGGKGDSDAKTAENNQTAFNQKLMKIFNAQYADQKGVLDYLKGKLQPMIDAPQGYDPATLAAMKSNAIDQNATNYQNALKGVQANMAGKGGPTGLPSGVEEQISGQLAGQEAATQTSDLQEIQVQDANLKQNNFWNAVNGENGVAAQLNPLGYAGQATSGSNAVAGLSEAYKSSKSSQLMGALGGIAGGALSAWAGKP